eukprot:COSAG01_NODE_6087_length_3860_cov_2.910420_1_plen_242_part_00
MPTLSISYLVQAPATAATATAASSAAVGDRPRLVRRLCPPVPPSHRQRTRCGRSQRSTEPRSADGAVRRPAVALLDRCVGMVALGACGTVYFGVLTAAYEAATLAFGGTAMSRGNDAAAACAGVGTGLLLACALIAAARGTLAGAARAFCAARRVGKISQVAGCVITQLYLIVLVFLPFLVDLTFSLLRWKPQDVAWLLAGCLALLTITLSIREVPSRKQKSMLIRSLDWLESACVLRCQY